MRDGREKKGGRGRRKERGRIGLMIIEAWERKRWIASSGRMGVEEGVKKRGRSWRESEDGFWRGELEVCVGARIWFPNRGWDLDRKGGERAPANGLSEWEAGC